MHSGFQGSSIRNSEGPIEDQPHIYNENVNYNFGLQNNESIQTANNPTVEVRAQENIHHDLMM